eukprot:TRINITY_DN1130_c0_g1_i1.p1 TRINITY_DN1130_c0_g1~~TRINITY_DN1130_c0_g1_i1.p1  ORF type:complete len:589 (-),score=224.24 TRINITY_DN1130_c0_g1_i1:10-1776(-)
MANNQAYIKLRRALNNEKLLLEEIGKLNPQEWEQIMNQTSQYSKAMAQQAQQKQQEQQQKAQESNKQYQQKLEEEKTKREEIRQKHNIEFLKVKNEENQKLQKILTEEEKKRTDYKWKKEIEAQEQKTKIKLEAELEFKKIEEEGQKLEQSKLDYKKKLEEENQQKELEREMKLVTHKLEEEAKIEVKLADFRYKQSLREHEAMKDDNLKRDVELEKLKQQGKLERDNLKLNALTNFFSGDDGRSRLFNIFGLFAGTITTIYFFKIGSPIATRWLKNFFFKPSLISKSVKINAFSKLKSLVTKNNKMPEVILQPKLQERMDRIKEGTKNTAARNGFFGNILLYGKPGTGKSMFAEKLAVESNMNFAMMSGPSFDQFSATEAITEIKNLFQWANSSSKPMILFIDECDSFLEDRSTLSPDRVRVLNEFIVQTGTENRKFMLCFETNRPEVLDPAVQSRITSSIEFVAPEKPEIRRMLDQYINRYIKKETTSFFSSKPKIDSSELNDDKLVDSISDDFVKYGFVGRDISNFVISLTQSVYADPNFKVTKSMIKKVVDEQLQKKKTEEIYSQNREQRIKERRLRNKLAAGD